MLEDKKVLVTGAGGFIGSHLVEALVERGVSVRAFVKYNGRGDWGMLSELPAESLELLEVVAGDIGDSHFVRKAVESCDVVFHLAALVGIPYSYITPGDYVRVNVQGTMNVLEACREAAVIRVIHTSTSETYGTGQYVPIDEKHPLQAQSPYAGSKIAADKMAEAYYRSFDLPVVVVRPFNTFGPRQSARAFIPTVISQALTEEKISLGSLEPVRDCTYVKDTTEGLIKAGCCDSVLGGVVNLGVGCGDSIGDIARLILKLMGREQMRIEQSPSRTRPLKSEVMQLISDNRIAREICGWQPQYSLERGLSETIDWVTSNLDRYRPSKYAV